MGEEEWLVASGEWPLDRLLSPRCSIHRYYRRDLAPFARGPLACLVAPAPLARGRLPDQARPLRAKSNVSFEPHTPPSPLPALPEFSGTATRHRYSSTPTSCPFSHGPLVLAPPARRPLRRVRVWTTDLPPSHVSRYVSYPNHLEIHTVQV